MNISLVLPGTGVKNGTEPGGPVFTVPVKKSTGPNRAVPEESRRGSGTEGTQEMAQYIAEPPKPALDTSRVFPGAAANVRKPELLWLTRISPACAGIERVIARAAAMAVNSG